jgi:hypothetical protein
VVGVGVPGAFGLKVSSRPTLSTAVHCATDGHATPGSGYALALAASTVQTPTSTQSRAAEPTTVCRTLIARTLRISTINGPDE